MADVQDISLDATPAPPALSAAIGDKQRMQEILTMIASEESDLAEISRLIALEIGSVISLMSENDPINRNNRSMTELNNHVKALRELQKTLAEADAESRKDVLNIEGPKFRWMFKEITDLFEKALKDANVDEDSRKIVMMNFRDHIQSNEDRLKRELNKIETGR